MYKYTEESSDDDDQPIIQQSAIVQSQLSLDHLICSICHHIVWQPICCGSSQGCHTAFCSYCIESWLKKPNSLCPNCKGVFFRSPIPPIMNALLDKIQFKCWNHTCQELVSYKSATIHFKECPYKLKKCIGCRKEIITKLYNQHIQQCGEFIVECQKCSLKMTKAEYNHHEVNHCFTQQVQNCSNRVSSLQLTIDQLENQASNLQLLTKNLFSGQPLQLQIQLYTTFNQNFSFPNPTLIKPSFNPLKQKFDFLHFYVITPIFTQSIVSREWMVKIRKMVGNILIGFCSSMNVNSLDYIINKYGQIKRKDLNQSKYRIVRKADDFHFTTNDVLKFKYYTFKKMIKILNQTKKIQMELYQQEIQQMGPKFYTFYSMDTLNDSISFT